MALASRSSRLREILSVADVICCCTPIREPLFKAADLQSDTKKLKGAKKQRGAKKAQFVSLMGHTSLRCR